MNQETMKITIKNKTSRSVLNFEDYQKRANAVVKTVVTKQINTANSKNEVSLNASQKAHTQCKSDI